MAQIVLIEGDSKSGKSTAIGKNDKLGILGLEPKETFIIQTINKSLPFPQSGKNYTPFDPNKGTGNIIRTSDSKDMVNLMAYINGRKDIKNLIFDDFQYVMGLDYMENAQQKGYDLFKGMAKNVYDILKPFVIQNVLRPDLFIFFMWHIETNTNDNGERIVRVKTAGKMVEQYLTPEGLFSVVLYSRVVQNQEDSERPLHVFQTRKLNENERIGAPYGMFEELYIKNDLGLVKSSMINYLYKDSQ